MACSKYFKKSLRLAKWKERVMGIEVQEFSKVWKFYFSNWEATEDSEHWFTGTNSREMKKLVRMLSQIIHMLSHMVRD